MIKTANAVFEIVKRKLKVINSTADFDNFDPNAIGYIDPEGQLKQLTAATLKMCGKAPADYVAGLIDLKRLYGRAKTKAQKNV